MSFSAHPMSAAIYFRRPDCLKILLEANSSFADMEPDQLSDIAHSSVCHVDGSPVGTKAAVRIIGMFLSTKEGRDLFTVALHPRHETTPLVACLYILSSFGRNHEIFTPDRKKMRDDSLTTVVEMLLKAGSSLAHDVLESSPLVLACIPEVKDNIAALLLKHGADANGFMGHDGQTCLNSALANEQVETVKMLLDYGADVNGIGPNGYSPFRMAHYLNNKLGMKVICNHPNFRFKRMEYDIAKPILSKRQLLSPEEKRYSYWGTKSNKVPSLASEVNCPALIQLVSEGTIEKLAEILGKCSISNLNAKTASGVTALHAATMKNDIEMVELLLEKGAEPNVKDASDIYPLMHAVKNPNALEVIDSLVSNGSDVNLKGSKGKTALFEAVQANRLENVEYLCSAQGIDVNIGELLNGTTPLHLMAQECNIPMMEILLKASNANVNVKNAFGSSPLHYVSKCDKKNAAKYLITKGALVGMKCTIAGNTPLHVAAACGSTEVAQLLIDKGVDVNAHNKYGETPLFVAAMTGHQSMVILLIEEDAEIDAKNIHGQTPLYIAFTYQQYEVAQILIRNGADIMAREKHRNETILHLVTAIGNIDYISCVFEEGADIEAKDIHGLTPLLRSAAIQSTEVGTSLIAIGCNVNATLDRKPKKVNFLDLVVQNKNTSLLSKIVMRNTKTKKQQLIPHLECLPKESKEAVMAMWKHWHDHPQEFLAGSKKVKVLTLNNSLI